LKGEIMNAIQPFVPRPQSDTGNASGALPSSAGLNNMFLQLLVAQLQNQSPLNPMDPTQFVGQLAQFSELSEITQIDQLLQQNLPASSSSAPKPSPDHATISALPDWDRASPAAAPALTPLLSNGTTQLPKSILERAIQGAF
jgi:hypothetical protein